MVSHHASRSLLQSENLEQRGPGGSPQCLVTQMGKAVGGSGGVAWSLGSRPDFRSPSLRQMRRRRYQVSEPKGSAHLPSLRDPSSPPCSPHRLLLHVQMAQGTCGLWEDSEGCVSPSQVREGGWGQHQSWPQEEPAEPLCRGRHGGEAAGLWVSSCPGGSTAAWSVSPPPERPGQFPWRRHCFQGPGSRPALGITHHRLCFPSFLSGTGSVSTIQLSLALGALSPGARLGCQGRGFPLQGQGTLSRLRWVPACREGWNHQRV